MDHTRDIQGMFPKLKYDKSWALLEKAHRYLWHATETAIYMTALDGGFQAEEFAVADAIDSVVGAFNDQRISVTPHKRNTRCIGSRFHFENAIVELLSNAQREVRFRGGRSTSRSRKSERNVSFT
jgi:hypothetical protein